METDSTLDGNAAGGLFAEVFVGEITAARGRCDGCGAVEAVGALRAYAGGPGTVLRCLHCESVVMRVVRNGNRCWLDLRGLRWLELSATE